MTGEPSPGLSKETKQKLLEFLCTFAWADAAIQPQEQQHMQRLFERLGLEPPQRAQTGRWLRERPKTAPIDVTKIPLEERKLFLKEAEALAMADGNVNANEKRVLDQLRAAVLKGK